MYDHKSFLECRKEKNVCACVYESNKRCNAFRTNSINKAYETISTFAKIINNYSENSLK